MEYKKKNLLDNTVNQPSTFKTKDLVEKKFETSMIRSSLCYYSDTYILVKGTIAVTNTERAVAANNINKTVIFKNYARFTDCIREINNNAIDIDVIMPIG